MNAVELKEKVAGEYSDYVGSFLNVQDPSLSEFITKEFAAGKLWPESLIQLNPNYEPSLDVSEFVNQGLLHQKCKEIFKNNSRPFRLYRHQELAVQMAAEKQPYVLTTGTGSGKSLAYLIPTIDHILKNNPGEHRTRALIVYPMNALINSQLLAVNNLLSNLEPDQDLIRVARYTGQDSMEKRKELQANPPHILLTNYVMLELMMSRPHERVFLDRTVASLDFFVLDELHTYTGRQGADVSMLVRRVRERCGNENLLCIGTSATMVSGGSREEQRQAVSEVASRIFGVNVPPENVIDETLKPSIDNAGDVTPAAVRECLDKEPPNSPAEFKKDALAAWIEQTFGIEKQDGTFRRRTPISIAEGAEKLAEFSGIEESLCRQKIEAYLEAGSALKDENGNPLFAIKLHQFFSQGDSVYATFEAKDERSFTMTGQQYLRDEEGRKRLLAPLLFCRICGQEYYKVQRLEQELKPSVPYELNNEEGCEGEIGYLVIEDPKEPIWSDDRQGELPENWFKDPETRNRIRKEYAEHVPQRIFVSPDGSWDTTNSEDRAPGWFLKSPLLVCPSCGEVYDKRRSEFAKLSRLSSEGRSTATTLLSLSTVSELRKEDSVEAEARKILSFTDNRQDASLQAGHFNDFVQVGLLRGSIYEALNKNETLDHTNIATEVVKALNLSPNEYAENPGDIGNQPQKNRAALTSYVEYLIYRDLRRGWRFIQPNLEQCGLIEIHYTNLEDVCKDEKNWENDPVLSAASGEERFQVARAFLNHLRFSLAINPGCLDPDEHETFKRKVNITLKAPWCFDTEELPEAAAWFRYGKALEGRFSLSPISLVGKYLRSTRAWRQREAGLSTDEYKSMLWLFVDVLNRAGFLSVQKKDDDFRIQLQVDSFKWKKGEGVVQPYDPVRSVRMAVSEGEEIRRETNAFFTDFYRNTARNLHGFEGREHTGQTQAEDREEREKRFAEGDLSCLFCSPTMELGIDIKDLVSVNMRNVPPSPANYAQRSGRAGRAGQPALITTYCSAGSGHDQYFFRNRDKMVAGVVSPPRIDLGNQELILAHLHAVWLSHVGTDLKDSIADLLDLKDPELPILADRAPGFQLSEPKIAVCIKACRAITAQCRDDLEKTLWFSDEWVERVVRQAARSFDGAFERWRELYRTADQQLHESHEKLKTAHSTKLNKDERQRAELLEREALRQKDLLCNRVRGGENSDFYIYRYLASEGFLPGYNFPRLPVRAFVGSKGKKGEFLSRSRFMAISEYAPRNIIYHEGARHSVVKSMLPVGDPESRFTEIKICKKCGAFHHAAQITADLCENCGTALDGSNSEYMANLFEMTTVVTQRRERITSNEEDRLRKGYEITTHYRFASHDGKKEKYGAQVLDGSKSVLLSMTHGPSAELWMINRKWRRTRESGFTLETDSGIWGKRADDSDDTALDVGKGEIRAGVHLYVRDSRNILLIKPGEEGDLDEGQMVSLESALKKAICAVYQVDETEIASTVIGEGAEQSILLWESAEGSIGVLERLIKEKNAVASIAKTALEICHFDPETGEETETECVIACYECLLAYYNQPEHTLLDRTRIKGLLMGLSQSEVQQMHQKRSYEEQYQWLKEQTDKKSELETTFLDALRKQGRRLPDAAQKFVEDPACSADFWYDDGYVCVFCDGSVHDPERQKKEDEKVRSALKQKGYRVVVIRYDQDLQNQIEQNADLFGVVKS